MSATPLRAPVLSAVRALLQPLGYRKTGAVFSANSQDVIHLLEVQGSRGSTNERARFTVNVAVFAPDLVYPDVREFMKPSVSAAHWRQRLGTLAGAGSDLWWESSSQSEGLRAATEIIQLIRHFALPKLAELANLKALLALWQSGASPGLTESQRNAFLAQLATSVATPKNAG